MSKIEIVIYIIIITFIIVAAWHGFNGSSTGLF